MRDGKRKRGEVGNHQVDEDNGKHSLIMPIIMLLLMQMLEQHEL